MMPLKIWEIMSDIKALIKAGNRAKAMNALDTVYSNLENMINTMNDTEKMELLGAIALRYREAGEIGKAISVLEKLCKIG